MKHPTPNASHERRCHDCGNVAIHADMVIPWVLCSKCGSQDTRRTKIIPPQGGSSSARSPLTAAPAYRESGPPCPGCCGTEPASPQSWRCPTHMLADALARVAELEEALQRIANCDHPIITKTIANKALKKS